MADQRVAGFMQDLLEKDLEVVARLHIFERVPYAFEEDPGLLDLLRDHLCSGLGLEEDSVRVVGSAGTGFSLDPDKFPTPFHENSDLDVLVVDEPKFDEIWKHLRKWHYPFRIVSPPRAESRWASARRKEVFFGWFHPTRVLDGIDATEPLVPLRDIRTQWFQTLQELSQYPDLADRQIDSRLYRTWDHAYMYHVDGLRTLRDTLSTKG